MYLLEQANTRPFTTRTHTGMCLTVCVDREDEKGNISWDNPMPIHIETRWKECLHGLQMLPTLNTPRCYLPLQFGKISDIELHFFSDASDIGYGHRTYLRHLHDLVYCCLVLSKSRVTPLRWSLFHAQN